MNDLPNIVDLEMKVVEFKSELKIQENNINTVMHNQEILIQQRNVVIGLSGLTIILLIGIFFTFCLEMPFL